MDESPTAPGEEMAARMPTPRYRWAIHLVLLTAYPILEGLVALFASGKTRGPLLPADVSQLLVTLSVELVIFALLFGLAWSASRATAEELRLKWRKGLQPIARGFLYAIGLRILVMVAVALFAFALFVLAGGDMHLLEKLQPRPEQIVTPQALLEHPVYLWLNLTFVSFVVAGLREELWRAGMLAGWSALFPKMFQSAKGKLIAIALVAVVFGFGHLPQGWGGVGMTTLLGLGLGVIMVYHRSIWEAALAHGFFDAATFLMLYLLARFHLDSLAGQR